MPSKPRSLKALRYNIMGKAIEGPYAGRWQSVNDAPLSFADAVKFAHALTGYTDLTITQDTPTPRNGGGHAKRGFMFIPAAQPTQKGDA